MAKRTTYPGYEQERVSSKTDIAGGEKSDRCDGHKRYGRLAEELGRRAVHVVAHEEPIARYPHDNEKEGCGYDAIDNGQKKEQLDRDDLQEAQCHAADGAQGYEAVEDGGRRGRCQLSSPSAAHR